MSRTPIRRAVVAAAALALITTGTSGPATAAASSGYRVTDLGTLGGASSAAVAVSTTSYAVGWADTAAGRRHAVRWDPSGHLLDLGTLGGPTSEATAVDDVGRVVGVADRADGSRHAFRWSSGSGMKDLGTLGGRTSTAVDINRSGAVAGTADRADGTSHAFLWRSDTGMRDLGTLGGPSSTAYALNDSGEVAGGSYLDGYQQSVFRWTPTTGLKDVLASLTEPSYLYAIEQGDMNEAGRVAAVVLGYTPEGVEGEWTVVWDPTQGVLPMSYTERNGYTALPLDLNDRGQLTGTRYAPSSGGDCWPEKAYVWDSTTGFRNLDPTTCHSESRAISSTGEVTGFLQLTDGTEAFAWTSTGLHRLGTLGGGSSAGAAISDSGRVVGSAGTAAGTSHAAAWDPTAGSSTRTVGATLDTYINSAAPTTAYGTSASLSAGSTSTTLLRFAVPAAPAGRALVAAALQLRTGSASSSGSSAAQAVHLTTSAWSNSTTWTTRPTLVSTRIGVIGPVPINTPLAVRLTPSAVLPGTVLSIGVNGTSSDSTWLWSTDSTQPSYRPQLVLVYR